MAAMVVEQPDGRWAYVVLVAAVLVRVVVNGLWATPGVMLMAALDTFGGSSADSAWIPSLLNGVSFLTCPVSGLLVQKFGVRKMALVGGVLTSLGLTSSSFARSALHLYFTYGILTGLGIGVAYISSTEALKIYFIKNRNFSLGLASGLSGLGNVVFPPLIYILVHEFGFNQMFLMVGGISAHMLPCAMLFRPVRPAQEAGGAKAQLETSTTTTRCSAVCHSWTFLYVWDFYVLISSCMTYIVGSSMVLAHLSAYTVERGVGSEQDASIMYAVIGAVLILSKILQGWLANLRRVKERVRWLYMGCYLLGGLSTLLLLLPSLPLAMLYVYSVLLGLSYAAFGGAIIPALIINITGDVHFAFAYGIIMCFCAVGQFLGPPLAGWLYDATGSYRLPFALACFCMVMGGAIMLVRCQGQADKVKASREDKTVASVEAADVQEKLVDSKPELSDGHSYQRVTTT